MRILVYGINYFPELIGIGKFTGEMTAWLARNGHEIRVITAQPSYPEWLVMPGYSAAAYRCNRWENVTVWRCPVWVPRFPTGLKRILHYLSITLSSVPIALCQVFWKPDIVLLVVPPLFFGPVALLVARLSGARSWLHLQDFEVSLAFETGLLRRPVVRKIALWVEQKLLQRFHRVSTISPRMLAGLHSKGVAKERCVLFPNWVDVEVIRPLNGQNRLRSEWALPEQVAVALYSGNMAGKQGLDILLEAARLLKDDESLRFVLCGEGAARKRLREEYSDLRNVIWAPLQEVTRLNELLNLADIHLLPQLANVADLVMPSKLTGMLASGRPVIATADAGSQVAQAVAQCGIVVPPGDATALAAAIRILAADPDRRRRLGSTARDYALKNFASSRILPEFESALVSCAKEQLQPRQTKRP
jgi:colanic acid biosynthesis glycosyl transferase WcaI